MIIEHKETGLFCLWEVTEEGRVFLCRFSGHPSRESRWETAYRQIADIHINGENESDHHFFKHTASSRRDTLRYVSHREETHPTGQDLIFVLADDSLCVTVTYRFYRGLRAVRTWTTVENTADRPLGLTYVSSFSYVWPNEDTGPTDRPWRVFIPHNAWQREANWKTYSFSELGYEKLSDFSGKRITVNNSGSFSTKEHLPMGAVSARGGDDVWLWQIENNGSWQWEISDLPGCLYLKISGPTEQENHWYRELKPGEHFDSVPVAVAVGSSFDDALADMTAYRRRILSRSEADRSLPIIFNDYMNCLWADPTEEKSLPLIERAAELGAEYYVMDAGWYAEGAWWDAVGEWQPNAGRFPHGLRALFDRVRAHGMMPGIWLEIEVMGIRCPLAEAWEDSCFLMRHGKRVIDNGRYCLDFRSPRVRAYAASVIDRLVGEYGVGYIKNDYNVDGGIGTEVDADSLGDGLLRRNRAFLSWLWEIRAKYPRLIWENCGSGGLRMDYAMLSAADLQSVTDQSICRLEAPIAAACATAVLPEQAAIWSYPLASDKETIVAMNMINAMPLRLYLSGEILRLSENSLALVKEGVSLYKRIRRDIAGSIPFYPLGLPGQADGWLCAAYRCPTCLRVAVWRLSSQEETRILPLSGNARILYPTTYECGTVTRQENGIAVTLKEQDSAVFLELE